MDVQGDEGAVPSATPTWPPPLSHLYLSFLVAKLCLRCVPQGPAPWVFPPLPCLSSPSLSLRCRLPSSLSTCWGECRLCALSVLPSKQGGQPEVGRPSPVLAGLLTAPPGSLLALFLTTAQRPGASPASGTPAGSFLPG